MTKTIDRFQEKISKESNGCWRWTASEKFMYKGKLTRPHRVIWEMERGRIPKGMSVIRKCENILCINPDHLCIKSVWNDAENWEQKFWKSIRVGCSDECWPWMAKSKNAFGYGSFRKRWTPETGRGKMTGAHRISYELKVGKIPKGMEVLHKCDNPACCNPKHLFVGTQRDNVVDCVNKGRANRQKGSQRRNSKITESIVRICRALFKPHSRRFGAYALARKYGIGGANMLNIVKGNAWRHVV